MVDILRGAIPVPIYYKELEFIGNVIGLSKEELFNIWENRLKQVLSVNGMNIYSNSDLITTMTECAKEYINNN